MLLSALFGRHASRALFDAHQLLTKSSLDIEQLRLALNRGGKEIIEEAVNKRLLSEKNFLVRSTGLNESVALIELFQKDLENKKAERLTISDKTFDNVHRTGLEPVTTRFEAGYSIRLSYQCKIYRRLTQY